MEKFMVETGFSSDVYYRVGLQKYILHCTAALYSMFIHL